MSKGNKFALAPAPYPLSTVPETKSIHILLGLLDEVYIKADISKSDKVPNIDGTIEVTDVNQVPQGKVEVQVKTLVKKRGTQTHQCHGNFIAYCKTAILPVILIAVDIKAKVAYWLYMDMNIIETAENKAVGDTVSVSFPDENIIDGNSLDYVEKWRVIINGRREKVFQYDFLKERMENVDKFLAELSEKFEPTVSLQAYDLVSVQKFLDHLNFILDYEFKTVKESIYPNYWKIGMAVIKFEKNNVYFILYPVKYGDSKPLIMKLKKGVSYNMHTEFLNDNFIMMASRSRTKFNRNPSAVAYELLNSDIAKFISETNLPLEDEFLSHEYLFGFLERYRSVFGFNPDEDTFPINRFQYVLYNLIPVHASRNISAAAGITEISCSIDDYERWGTSSINRIFSDAENAIKEGYLPQYKVDVRSRHYNMKLVRYFLNAMSEKDILRRKYRFGIHHIGSLPNRKNWNDNVLLDILHIFWCNFYKVYTKYINQNFPHLKDELKLLLDDEILVVKYVHLENGSKSLELYFVQLNRTDLPKIVFFDFASPDAPINDHKVMIQDDWNCKVLGVPGRIKLKTSCPLNFLLEPSPTYSLINYFLNAKIETFFNRKIKREDPFEYV